MEKEKDGRKVIVKFASYLNGSTILKNVFL